MASHNFTRTQALEKEVKTLFAEIAIGATGAPTLTKGLGISSVARSGTGAYTLTLSSQYQRLLHASVTLLDADAEDLVFQVTNANTTTSSVKQTTPTVTFVCKAYDGDGAVAAADPSNGATLLVRIDLKNTGVGE